MNTNEEQRFAEQASADNISLDFTKWSEMRRQKGLSVNHDLWTQERDRVLSRRQYENSEIRRKRLASLGEQRLKESERSIEDSLSEEKERLKHKWLAENPNETESDFENKAWSHFRVGLLEEHKNQQMEAALQDSKNLFQGENSI